MKNGIKTIALTVVLSLVATASLAAAPWSPKQQQRHHQLRRLNHKIVSQERSASRAFWNGNVGGALQHAAVAQNMADRQQHIKHQMHRSNHKWERNHVHCRHGYCV
jgi:hypothetical protein